MKPIFPESNLDTKKWPKQSTCCNFRQLMKKGKSMTFNIEPILVAQNLII